MTGMGLYCNEVGERERGVRIQKVGELPLELAPSLFSLLANLGKSHLATQQEERSSDMLLGGKKNVVSTYIVHST